MRAALVALVALVATVGCGSRPLPTPVVLPPPPAALPVCAGQPEPTTEDVCPGLFASGYACARCTGFSGCLDVRDGIWCAGSSCTADALCLQGH